MKSKSTWNRRPHDEPPFRPPGADSPRGVPNCPAWVMEEEYSHEVSSAGWWPLSRELGPAFYAYIYPEPPGYRGAAVRPPAAFHDTGLGEFILRHDDVRVLDDPDAAVLAFLEDTYAGGADLAGWPRRAFESASYPNDGQPWRAWSTSTTEPAGWNLPFKDERPG